MPIDQGHRIREEVTMSPQELVFLPLGGAGEIGLNLNLYGLDRQWLMVDLGIDHLARRFPGETSLGEQQRTAVARALVSAPRLLVVDEPTSHQDDHNTHRISALLRAAAESGSAVLVATHDRRVTGHATVHHRIVDGRLTSG